MIHGYDRIDYPALWFAVQESLPLLRAEVETLLREAEDRVGGHARSQPNSFRHDHSLVDEPLLASSLPSTSSSSPPGTPRG